MVSTGESGTLARSRENRLSNGENTKDSARKMGGMINLVKNSAMPSTIGSVTSRMTRKGRCRMKRKRGGSSYGHRYCQSTHRKTEQSGAYRKESCRFSKSIRDPYTQSNRDIEYECHQRSLHIHIRSVEGSILGMLSPTHVLDYTMQWASQANSYRVYQHLLGHQLNG